MSITDKIWEEVGNSGICSYAAQCYRLKCRLLLVTFYIITVLQLTYSIYLKNISENDFHAIGRHIHVYIYIYIHTLALHSEVSLK